MGRQKVSSGHIRPKVPEKRGRCSIQRLNRESTESGNVGIDPAFHDHVQFNGSTERALKGLPHFGIYVLIVSSIQRLNRESTERPVGNSLRIAVLAFNSTAQQREH